MGRLYDSFVRAYRLDEEPDAEFFDIIKEIYFSEEVQGLARYPQHSSINRLDHITGVAYLTYCEARRRGLDYRAATRGAVLHDLFYYDWHDSSWSHRPNGYRHPGFALVNARILCGEALSEVEENIILRHMWPLTPIPPKYKESWLLVFTDKYCAGREMLIAGSRRFREDFQSRIDKSKTVDI